MDQETMPNWLEQRAYLTPDRIAFITEDESITFKELSERVQHKAKQLLYLKIKPQEKIGVLSGNSLEMIILYHAASSIRAVTVPLNVRLNETELSFQLKDCGANILFYEKHSYEQKVLAVLEQQPDLTVISLEQLAKENVSTKEPYKEIIMDEPHTIIYTSGTTGFPKGVVLTYRNHWWSAIGSVLNLGLNISDNWLSCVPLFHVSGLSILMKNVIYGMSVTLYRSFDPKKVNHAIIEGNVSMVSVVSTMLQAMLQELDQSAYPPSFRCMLLGGGPAPKVILERCRDKNIPVYQTYGLTESASQIVTLSPEYMIEKLGSAGKPLFPAQIKIMIDNQQAQSNVAGEIVIKGPNVTKQYFKRSEATVEAIKNDWLSTGDIGYLDDDGFLYVLDRRKDLIISGGENVYPAEIESALLHHPLVEEVGVVGIEDDKWGQVPVAFIHLKEQTHINKEEIVAFAEEKLAAYKVPKQVYFVGKLPRNASNKLLRRELLNLEKKEV